MSFYNVERNHHILFWENLGVLRKYYYFFEVQAALIIRGGYVPRKYREYQNREY